MNDRKIANGVDYDGVKFPVQEKKLVQLKLKTAFALFFL